MLASSVGVAQHSRILYFGTHPDSSFYTIAPVSDSTYWIGGENGYLKETDSSWNIKPVSSPIGNRNILWIRPFGPQKMLVTTDSGAVYLYDKLTLEWKMQQVAAAKRSIYRSCIINDSTAAICGGHHKIAKGHRSVPYGFVFLTKDGGATWQRIFYKPFHFIFDVSMWDHELMAAAYAPWGSSIWRYDLNKESWKKDKSLRKAASKRYIFQKFGFPDAIEGWVTGGKYNRRSKGKGAVYDYVLGTSLISSSSGFIWAPLWNADFVVFLCTGKVLWRLRNDVHYEWLDIGPELNLYDGLFIGPKTFLAVGSNQFLVKVHIENPRQKDESP